MSTLSLTAALLAALLAGCSAPAATQEPDETDWGAAWATAVQRPTATDWFGNWSQEGFDNHSLRQVIRVSVAGTQLRLRLSNAYGTAPLHVTGATVGKAAEGAAVHADTLQPLRFTGSPTVTIPAGERLASDPVPLPVEALEELTVTLYFQGATGPATFHNLAMTTSYRAGGDHLLDPGADAFQEESISWYYLEGADVSGSPAAAQDAVVAFGDSLTDGFGATPGGNDRYPDVLADRLLARGRPQPVLNAGIGGNRLLNDSACYGEKAAARFQRDVLDQAGVAAVIVQLGTNDIQMGEGAPTPCRLPNPRVTADELIGGFRELIHTARANNVAIIGGTIPPIKGSRTHTERFDQVRHATNEWIRTSGEFDAVADFDRALADPADPDRLLPAYDSGDHLHPNAAGHVAMAEAVDLDRL